MTAIWITASGQGMAEANIGVERVMSTYYTKPQIESINVFYRASEFRLKTFCTCCYARWASVPLLPRLPMSLAMNSSAPGHSTPSEFGHQIW